MHKIVKKGGALTIFFCWGAPLGGAFRWGGAQSQYPTPLAAPEVEGMIKMRLCVYFLSLKVFFDILVFEDTKYFLLV